MKRKYLGKVVHIKWRDSKMFLEQSKLYDTDTVCIIDSYGLVIREEDDNIAITRDVVDDEYRAVLIIPAENIVKIKVL